MGLVLSRIPGESIRIGEDVVVTVVKVSGKKVRLDVVAPQQTRVVRTELERRTAITPRWVHKEAS